MSYAVLLLRAWKAKHRSEDCEAGRLSMHAMRQATSGPLAIDNPSGEGALSGARSVGREPIRVQDPLPRMSRTGAPRLVDRVPARRLDGAAKKRICHAR